MKSTSANVYPSQASVTSHNNETNHSQYQFTLTDNQIEALKSIRTRNLSQFKINDVNSSQMNTKNKSVNTMLEKNSKLPLANFF